VSGGGGGWVVLVWARLCCVLLGSQDEWLVWVVWLGLG
jgi:hypothetical protein